MSPSGASSAARFSARTKRASASGPSAARASSSVKATDASLSSEEEDFRSDDLRSNASRSFAVCAARSAATDSRMARFASGATVSSATSSLGANASANASNETPRDESTAMASERLSWIARVTAGSGAIKNARRTRSNSSKRNTPSPSTSKAANARRIAAPLSPNFSASFARRSASTPSAVPARPRIVATSRGGFGFPISPFSGSATFATRRSTSVRSLGKSAGRSVPANSLKSIAPSPSTSKRENNASRTSSSSNDEDAPRRLNRARHRRTSSRPTRVPAPSRIVRNALITWCRPALLACCTFSRKSWSIETRLPATENTGTETERVRAEAGRVFREEETIVSAARSSSVEVAYGYVSRLGEDLRGAVAFSASSSTAKGGGSRRTRARDISPGAGEASPSDSDVAMGEPGRTGGGDGAAFSRAGRRAVAARGSVRRGAGGGAGDFIGGAPEGRPGPGGRKSGSGRGEGGVGVRS